MTEPDVPDHGEQRFEALRARVGLWMGPAVFLAVFWAPLDLTAPQQRLAAIFALVIVYWLTEAAPIPVTSLMGLALCVLLGVGPAGEVFGAFASPTIFLFMGSFMIARAMSVHSLDRRFAYLVLSLPRVCSSSVGIIVVFGAVCALLSAFMSNTATTAMMVPIGIGLVGVVAAAQGQDTHTAERSRFATALMLMAAYSASIGGLLTPVGSPPNLIGRALLEQQGANLPFFTWVGLAAPIVAIMFVLLCVVLIALNRPETQRLHGVAAFVRAERVKLGPLSDGEINTLVAFGTAVILWMAPGIAALAFGESSPLAHLLAGRVEEATVALSAAVMLFFMPLPGGGATLSWREAARIDWGTILLFGAGIVFGTLMHKSGLAQAMGSSLGAWAGGASPLVLTLVATVVAVAVSETTSNTASVAIVVPVVLPVAQAAGVDPMLPGLAAVFGASFGFMLPVSTPPNAIAYASGMVPITRMVRSGLLFDIAGAAVIVVGLWLMLGGA